VKTKQSKGLDLFLIFLLLTLNSEIMNVLNFANREVWTLFLSSSDIDSIFKSFQTSLFLAANVISSLLTAGNG
jgi:ABC-type sulfate transport system permease component